MKPGSMLGDHFSSKNMIYMGKWHILNVTNSMKYQTYTGSQDKGRTTFNLEQKIFSKETLRSTYLRPWFMTMIDRDNLLLAFQMTAEVGDPYFCLGYNSFGAFATINHLRLQGMKLLPIGRRSSFPVFTH
ncbi:hypothetical protein ACFE04_012694 [Oxalis oulophora]